MKRLQRTDKYSNRQRSAFTLVEMLVATTLILLIMSLFAGIFTVATDIVKTQRGIAENDQVARHVVTLLEQDLAKRTMRYVYPYFPTEESGKSPTPFGTRAGYVYISINDPDSFHDDLIQFTVDARLLQQSQDNTEYFGVAQRLHDLTNGVDLNLTAHPNQPEADDGELNPNGVSASHAAEIAIFARNGKLYRRVSLLREPLSVAGEELDIQPHSNFTGPPSNPPLMIDENSADAVAGQIGGLYFITNPGNPPTPSNDFWRSFDFSALPVSTAGLPNLNEPTNAEFVGIEVLNNELPNGLGIPANRLGFNPLTGQSREHDRSVATSQRFIGKLLQAETSSPNCNWPIAYCEVFPGTTPPAALGPRLGSGNPYDLIGTPLTLVPGNDVVSEFPGPSGRGGVRAMEDLFLANLHEFRVEIWDDALQRFVVPGYGATTDADSAVGDYHIRRNLQFDGTTIGYGPLAVAGVTPHVFDTWHPGTAIDFDGDTAVEATENLPPYIPYRFYPPRQNESTFNAGEPPGPSSLIAPGEPNPGGNAAAPVVSYWKESTAYVVGNVVFARNAVDAQYPGWDANPVGAADGVFDWPLDDLGAQGILAPLPEQGFQIAYQCVVAGTTGAAPPTWPATPGRRVADGGAVWVAIDNRRPLSAIRLTIRFQSGASDNIRQVSQIIPLLEE